MGEHAIAVDLTDPTLICKIRIPLTSKALITLAAVVMDHPEHSVHVEGDWLAVRALVAPTPEEQR